MSEQIVVAALGDSIVAGSPGWDPDPAVRARMVRPDRESQWEHWAALADPRFDFRNCGVYGERAEEIARRLDRSAQGASVLVVQGGINDIAQGRSVEAAGEALHGMVVRGRELGLLVALVNVLPWNNGWPAAEEPVRRLNTLVDGIGAQEDVRVLPFYETLEDSGRPGRMPESWTSDGDHPSVEGYRRLGELVARELGSIVRRSTRQAPRGAS